MIIDITKSGYRKGYLPKTGVGVFHPFFATANAAFRKEALERAGPFDTHCATGEDVDLSIRVAKVGYELWFEPSARIAHFHRYTLRGLLKQWFGYGFGHAYLFRKHSPGRRLQLYRYDLSPNNANPFGIARVIDVPFPMHVMIFLSSFHLMHLSLLVAAIASLSSHTALAAVAATACIGSAAWYFGLRFDPKTPGRSVALSAIRYVADLAYVIGGLMGGLREGVLYLEATRTRKRA
jgi:cellulose synthase/poly-beta-1,6-N-acetylglucosamine synthase-like glycosyltransferase